MKNIEYMPYGKIKIKLDGYLSENKITTYMLAKATGLEFKTIQNLRKENIKRIDFDVLAKICYVLEVGIEEIIEYKL